MNSENITWVTKAVSAQKMIFDSRTDNKSFQVNPKNQTMNRLDSSSLVITPPTLTQDLDS
jgi:hypothetical protein